MTKEEEKFLQAAANNDTDTMLRMLDIIRMLDITRLDLKACILTALYLVAAPKDGIQTREEDLLLVDDLLENTMVIAAINEPFTDMRQDSIIFAEMLVQDKININLALFMDTKYMPPLSSYQEFHINSNTIPSIWFRMIKKGIPYAYEYPGLYRLSLSDIIELLNIPKFFDMIIESAKLTFATPIPDSMEKLNDPTGIWNEKFWRRRPQQVDNFKEIRRLLFTNSAIYDLVKNANNEVLDRQLIDFYVTQFESLHYPEIIKMGYFNDCFEIMQKFNMDLRTSTLKHLFSNRDFILALIFSEEISTMVNDGYLLNLLDVIRKNHQDLWIDILSSNTKYPESFVSIARKNAGLHKLDDKKVIPKLLEDVPELINHALESGHILASSMDFNMLVRDKVGLWLLSDESKSAESQKIDAVFFANNDIRHLAIQELCRYYPDIEARLLNFYANYFASLGSIEKTDPYLQESLNLVISRLYIPHIKIYDILTLQQNLIPPFNLLSEPKFLAFFITKLPEMDTNIRIIVQYWLDLQEDPVLQNTKIKLSKTEQVLTTMLRDPEKIPVLIGTPPAPDLIKYARECARTLLENAPEMPKVSNKDPLALLIDNVYVFLSLQTRKATDNILFADPEFYNIAVQIAQHEATFKDPLNMNSRLCDFYAAQLRANPGKYITDFPHSLDLILKFIVLFFQYDARHRPDELKGMPIMRLLANADICVAIIRMTATEEQAAMDSSVKQRIWETVFSIHPEILWLKMLQQQIPSAVENVRLEDLPDKNSLIPTLMEQYPAILEQEAQNAVILDIRRLELDDLRRFSLWRLPKSLSPETLRSIDDAFFANNEIYKEAINLAPNSLYIIVSRLCLFYAAKFAGMERDEIIKDPYFADSIRIFSNALSKINSNQPNLGLNYEVQRNMLELRLPQNANFVAALIEQGQPAVAPFTDNTSGLLRDWLLSNNLAGLCKALQRGLCSFTTDELNDYIKPTYGNEWANILGMIQEWVRPALTPSTRNDQAKTQEEIMHKLGYILCAKTPNKDFIAAIAKSDNDSILRQAIIMLPPAKKEHGLPRITALNHMIKHLIIYQPEKSFDFVQELIQPLYALFAKQKNLLKSITIRNRNMEKDLQQHVTWLLATAAKNTDLRFTPEFLTIFPIFSNEDTPDVGSKKLMFSKWRKDPAFDTAEKAFLASKRRKSG